VFHSAPWRSGHRLSFCLGLAAITILGGCGSSMTKHEACQAMTVKTEHDVCVAELRGEAGKPVKDIVAGSPTDTAPPLPYVATLYLTSEDGYTARVVFRRGNLKQASPDITNGSATLGSACAVSDETDAEEPFELSITNTTQGYAALPGIDIFGRAPNSNPPGVLAEMDYRSGPECRELRSDASAAFAEDASYYLALSSIEPLETGEEVSADGFLIVPNYFSPAYPQGDPNRLYGVVLELAPQISDEHFGVGHAKGVLESQVMGPAVAVLPGNDGGCTIHPPC
jgi:hypothetical protein